MKGLARITLGIACAACAASPFEQQQDDLTIAQARWRAAAVADYSFNIQRSCFCLPTATRVVRGTVYHGAFATLSYVDDGTAADTSLFRDFLTVDRVFAFLRRALDERPTTFVASYHAHLGYPIEVGIDYRAGIADDELSLRVPDLRIAPVP